MKQTGSLDGHTRDHRMLTLPSESLSISSFYLYTSPASTLQAQTQDRYDCSPLFLPFILINPT